MKHLPLTLLAILASGLFAGPAEAAKTWTASLTGWSVYLENDLVWVTATGNLSACTGAKAQLSTSATLGTSTSFSSELYTFIMASYAAQLPLKIVYESAETNPCKIYGAKNE